MPENDMIGQWMGNQKLHKISLCKGVNIQQIVVQSILKGTGRLLCSLYWVLCILKGDTHDIAHSGSAEGCVTFCFFPLWHLQYIFFYWWGSTESLGIYLSP
jgi:hypothetical protein